MRLYYPDEPLSDIDAQFVQEAMELAAPPMQIRIPHVLPADRPQWTLAEFEKYVRVVRSALRNAGIDTDKGTQVLLVAPKDMYWYSLLVQAVHAETGCYPWLIQTAEQRASLGNDGETRILDTHGLMGLKE